MEGSVLAEASAAGDEAPAGNSPVTKEMAPSGVTVYVAHPAAGLGSTQSATHTRCLSFPIVIFEKIHWFEEGCHQQMRMVHSYLEAGEPGKAGDRQPPGELTGHLQHGKEPMQKRGPVS